MQFAILGPVLVNGSPPRGAKERALLARLLATPGVPVRADELIEAAWPDGRRDGVVRSLHVRLAKLRAILDPDRTAGTPGSVLVRTPGGYALAVAAESTDAHRFSALAEEAAHRPPASALAGCEEALGLWRGEPFDDLEHIDAAAAVEARRLHAVRDRLRHMRAIALRDLGRLEEAADDLEALVEEDPLREELVRDLMLVRYGAGQHAAALDAYRQHARRLADVGLQPSPELRDVESLILHHREAPARIAPAAPRHRSNVGARVASVVGREDDLATIASALAAHRVVSLVGPAGVGKTTLAAETARSQLGGMHDGTWLVELAPLRSADEVLPAIGTALGLRRVGTGADAGDLDAMGVLRERLVEARMLLVLDRAEHLVPDLGDVVARIAAAGSGVAILVASRRPLGIAGEAVVPVRPLDADDAAKLFVERANAARADGIADVEDVAAVARICHRLDGLPLALELAAARVRALPAASIAERLEAGLGVPGRGTLDAAIDASYALLSPQERELYRRLSVFAGAFRLEDAERVGAGDGIDAGDVVDLVVSLTEHSMLQAEAGSPRPYRMLEALRDHGRAQLETAAAEATARRHAVHFARIAATTAGEIHRVGAEAVGDPLVPVQWDLDTAFRWAFAAGETDIALDLATGLGSFHHLVGTVTLGRELIDQALGMPGGRPDKRLGAMRWQIGLLLCELRLPAAATAIARAHELATRHGGQREIDELRTFEAQLALFQGDLERAEALGAGVAERALARGDRYTAAYASWTSGLLARTRGEPEEAVAQLRAACEVIMELVDVCALDNCAAALAEAATAAGLDDQAAEICDEVLAFAPERPLGERNTYLLHEAALSAARRGDLDRALELAGAALTGAGRDPVSIGPWHAPAARGDVALATGDVDAARAEYDQALALALGVRAEVGSSLPVEVRIALSHLRLAAVAQAPGVAAEHIRRAAEHARASRAPAVIAAVDAAAAPAAVGAR